MRAVSFRGGVHPPENKKITEKRAFENLTIPYLCRIPLQQHIGKPAIPIVNVGDFVKEGQLLAEADGFVSANIHASIPGRVINIDKYPTPFSEAGECIEIEVEGSFSGFNNKVNTNWEEKTPAELLQEVTAAGIVGMGGAAFPTHVKLSPPKDKTIDTLIVNAAECEPFLTVDDQLTQVYAEEIITGIRIVLKILNIKNAVIGAEKNTPKAINKLKQALAANSPEENIKVQPVRTKYPQGSEKQLIQALTKRVVPSGSLPMDAHVVVQNVGTIYAIYNAIVQEKPLYERYITVTGSLVNKPGNYKVKIGTRISDIIEECGGLKEQPAKIVLGGPMCGLAINSTEIPIIKGTSGILFLSAKETAVNHYYPCIHCGKCIAACPINLMPNKLSTAVENGLIQQAEKLNPFDCIMCGACSYICPSRRPISHFIKVAQQQIRANKLKKQ
jgi:electron transport complex protein RnfC